MLIATNFRFAYKHSELLFDILISVSCFIDHLKLGTLPRHRFFFFAQLLKKILSFSQISAKVKQSIKTSLKDSVVCINYS